MRRPNNLEDYRNRLQELFNFSFVSHKRQTVCPYPIHPLTSDERRGLAMWVSTLVQPYGDQFIHALKNSRQLSLGYLNLYLLRHYSHLKTIIRYFVMGTLIDYSKIGAQEQIQQQCIFLNIVIEELASRFFRESQWLQKISHLMPYNVFSIFDRFQKGYTSLREIKQVISDCLQDLKLGKLKETGKYSKKARRLLQYKLSRNLPQYSNDLKIYQQNIDELMNRANLLNFEASINDRRQQATSNRYVEIHRRLAKFDQILTERQRINQIEELARSRKEQEQLELMRQDIRIKQQSEILILKECAVQKQKPSGLQTARLEHSQKFFSTPYSTQLSKRQANSQYSTNYGQMMQSEKPELLQKFRQRQNYATNRKQNIQFDNHHEGQVLFENLMKIEANKSKLAIRSLIMNELAAVRQERRKNHLQLLRYI